MIVAEQKTLAEIDRLVRDAKKLMIVGCRECVTVCMAGGEKEVEILASALRLKWENEGHDTKIVTAMLQRQCEPEYVAELEKQLEGVDLILSMACGVGVQYVAEKYPIWVVPGLNTKFAGGAVEQGVWTEKCGLCGECILHLTGGVCPVIRCSKSLMNGPCGGSHDGKCEVGTDVDCAWALIYERLKKMDRLDLMLDMQPVKDWSKSRDGGPRKVVREDVRL
ncbi:MAG TPA: methylenetetrahydrofolate reductase C-terminal domain-containing protein [Bacillota bacterium]|jgi:ferredoxin